MSFVFIARSYLETLGFSPSSWFYPGSAFAPPSHDASAGHGEALADRSDSGRAFGLPE